MRTLQQALNEALAAEDYERAAQLRDDIAKLGPDAQELVMGEGTPPGVRFFSAPKSWFGTVGPEDIKEGKMDEGKGYTVNLGPFPKKEDYPSKEQLKRALPSLRKRGEDAEKAGHEFRMLLQGGGGYELPMDRAQLDFEALLKKWLVEVRAELERRITEMDGTPPNSYSAAQHGVRIIDHREQTETYVWRGKAVMKVSYSVDGWRVMPNQ